MKKINFIAACLLVACGIIVISCNQDGDYDEDFYGLDVIRYTSVAKTAQFEPTGATQKFGNGTNDYDDGTTVPTYKDECTLWSLVTVAVNKKTKFEVTNKKGDTEYNSIGHGCTASYAYEYVKSLAQGQTWREDGEEHVYTNGAMPPSIAANIAREAGIMEGITRHFNTYQELYDFISDPSWANDHPSGTYMISNDKLTHTCVCNGIKKGEVKLQRNRDNMESQPKCFNTDDNSNDGFVLIY